MENDRCGSCRWYRPNTVDSGFCQYKPPTVVCDASGIADSHLPVTLMDSTCRFHQHNLGINDYTPPIELTRELD